MFTSYGIDLPETSASAIFLDAPLLAGPYLDSVLERKRLELRRLSQRLEHMPSRDCLYLLYATYYSSTHYAYLFRITPCTDSPELPLYDGVLRESLVTNQYIDLDDHKWSQALLSVRWSRLDIRRVVSLAPSAYMTSAASTAELTSSLPRLDSAKSLTVECMATAMSACIMLTSCPPTSSTAVIYCYQGLLSPYQAGAACAQ
jgi:hypothetical protein